MNCDSLLRAARRAGRADFYLLDRRRYELRDGDAVRRACCITFHRGDDRVTRLYRAARFAPGGSLLRFHSSTIVGLSNTKKPGLAGFVAGLRRGLSTSDTARRLALAPVSIHAGIE
jgi:hypothetical protein